MKTRLPSGKEVSLTPFAVDTDFVKQNNNIFTCAPGLGEHNVHVYKEAGLSEQEIEQLKNDNVI